VVTEKPLYVRVAEALGWTGIEIEYVGQFDFALGTPPGTARGTPSPGHLGIQQPPTALVPRYDVDWSATGPLIERYVSEAIDTGAFEASSWEVQARGAVGWARGRTLLLAVCNLILELRKSGKL
jgi:hypothetical protein